MLSPTKHMVQFGPFELDQSTWQLRRNGTRVRLPLQPLQLLAVLLEQPGIAVSREELRQRLWPSEVFVDFDHGLNKNIQKLREALGDSAGQPRYIETLPRVGYRFIGSLTDEAPSLANEPHPETPEMPLTLLNGPAVRQRIWGRKLLWAVFAGCLAAVVGLAAWLVQKRAHAAPIHSLAVLPLENLSGDPNQEYFAEGMTDELITELARIPNLRVVSRTSVMQDSGSRKPLREIARELDVDAVVEGSVVRSGEKVRITAQLIDVREDKHLWAESFEEPANDVLALQDKIARQIALQTKVTLAPEQASVPARIDPAAEDAYLRGLYFLHRRRATESIEHFQQAVSIEPSFAGAHAGMAQALLGLGLEFPLRGTELMPQGLAAAKRAIALDPACGRAYTALGTVEMFYELDWPAAGRDLERGIALSPNDSLAEMEYSLYLDAMNRPEEAVAHMRRALKLDPLSFLMTRHLGSALYLARQYDEALYYFKLALEMEPPAAGTVQDWMQQVYRKKGMQAEEVEVDLAFSFTEAEANDLRSVYRRGGWRNYQLARLQMLRRVSRVNPVAFTGGCNENNFAINYLALGDRDQAMPYIRRAFDLHCWNLVWTLRTDPLWDDVRTDSRYRDLMQRIYASEVER
jgi:TolB-like protein/DNA-binding winged helix-turn-helix (wHTH) protein